MILVLPNGEKSIVLGEDAKKVEKILEMDIETDLTRIVRLPFPTFAEVYFKSFSAASPYIKEPTAGEEEGFNFEGEMAMLNPVAYMIIAKYLGLYGYDRISPEQIANELKVPNELVCAIIKTIFPLLTKTAGEFKNKIGYVENQSKTGYNEYRNTQYRSHDIKAEYWFYLNNIASPAEKQILSGLNDISQRIYVIQKNFGWATEQICKNLVVIPNDIKKAQASIEGTHI